MPGFNAVRSPYSPEYLPVLETFVIVGGAGTAAIALGDIVVTTGTAILVEGTPTAIRLVDGGGDAGANFLGIVEGFDVDPDNEVVGIPAATLGNRKVLVNINPFQLFEVEPDDTSLTIADVGSNVGVNVVDSTVGGISESGMTLDASTATTGEALLPYRIYSITEFDSVVTTQVAKVLVMPNSTFFKIGTVGI